VICCPKLEMTAISKDRWLIALIALLLSAFVVAEQSEKLPTYDDLMKDSIYDSSGRWRRKDTAAEDDWRRVQESEAAFSYGPPDKSDRASQKFDTDARDRFNFENAEPGYRLFKIEI